METKIEKDIDGILTYEYIVNNIGEMNNDDIDNLVIKIKQLDTTGKYIVSTARYLNAVDAELYKKQVESLLEAEIEADREHKYIGDLLASIWGNDYEARKEMLIENDNNFRRIYKRMYPKGI